VVPEYHLDDYIGKADTAASQWVFGCYIWILSPSEKALYTSYFGLTGGIKLNTDLKSRNKERSNENVSFIWMVVHICDPSISNAHDCEF
jgi:hypothetical protein